MADNKSDSDNLDDSFAEWDKDEEEKFGKNFNQDNKFNNDEGGDSSDSSSSSDSDNEDKKKESITNKQKYKEQKDVGYGHHLINNEDVSEKPPLVVVVQGPKKSGKTTLIKSLVKHYTKHKLQTIQGNITVRAGKNQRVTFIECPTDINAMIDLAKIADLALLMIDVSLGFELETFEFLSLLRSHGFPNVMGILTHMDYFKDNKQLRKTRKRYKKRFEHEVGSDYKLFYLQGLQNNLYPQRDILNLARYISIIKYAEVPWKLNHPFIVPDRWENNDEGSQKIPNDQLVDVSFYGYVRGCSYRTNARVNIIGLGDYDIGKVEVLDDPCPNMNKEDKDILKIDEDDDEDKEDGDDDEGEDGGEEGEGNTQEGGKKKKGFRTLKQKERIVYAPYSNLGFLNYEKTGGYITIPDKYVYYTRKEKIEKFDNEDEDGKEKEIEEEDQEDENDENKPEGVSLMRDLQDLKQGIDEKKEEDMFLLEGVKLKNDQEETQKTTQDKLEEIQDEAQRAFNKKQREIMSLKHKTQNIQKLKHAQTISDTMLATDLHDLIYGNNEQVSQFDSSRFQQQSFLSREMYKKAVKKQFMAGSGYGLDEDMNLSDSDDEDAKKKKEAEEEAERERMEEEAKKNEGQLDQFMNSYLGIYKKGTYIKMSIKLKYKHYKQFNPAQPLIIARINPGEDNFGFVKTKFKKHRWYGNLLKSKDPLIFSIGWRRFQSIPVFCTEDQDIRTRYLKYTPQHDYCTAIFYGNFAPQNTGFIVTQSLNDKLEKFRIAGTGQVIELNHNFDVMKKLKLIGEPFKIYKNSAFIKGMFNSSLEVSKFEGAQIKTVSGIRGQIKKAVKEGGEGCYRATFEDKIVKSDLVFLRTWFKMPLQKFYNPIVSYERMRLMKTTWELRKQAGIKFENNKDSEYKDIERQERKFQDVRISKNLQEALPFKTKEKTKFMSKKEKLARKEEKIPIKSLQSDKEKQAYALIQRLNTIRNEKQKLKQDKMDEKNRIKTAQKQGEMKKFEVQRKEYKKKQMKDKFTKQKKQKTGNEDNNDE